MAKIISHRGNLTGPNSVEENTPDVIDHCVYKLNIDVEIDLWCKDDKLYLGHDGPVTEIKIEFLRERQQYLWIHAKNREALSFCLQEGLHVFTHENDPYTITSRGYAWAYPGQLPVGHRCIGVMPEPHWNELPNFYGICTDYPMNYISI